MLPISVVGWASKWDVVVQTGAGEVSQGAGIDIRSVVEVPSESTTSPGLECVTIVAGLSPVNGATMQSIHEVLIFDYHIFSMTK